LLVNLILLLKLPYVGFVLLLVNLDDAVFIFSFLTFSVLLLVVLEQKLAELFLVDFNHVVVLICFSFDFLAEHFSIIHELFSFLTIKFILIAILDSFFVVNGVAIFVFVLHFVTWFIDDHLHIFAHLAILIIIEFLVSFAILHLHLAFPLVFEFFSFFLLLNEHLVVFLGIGLSLGVFILIIITLDLALTLVRGITFSIIFVHVVLILFDHSMQVLVVRLQLS
jgi:hypothetical protein